MVWAKIDDGILDNPKMARVGVFGFAMHVAAISWSCRNLTDGFVPHSVTSRLLPLSRVMIDSSNPLALTDGDRSMGGEVGLDPYVVADALVDSGLWREVDGGYEIHDFLVYNPSRSEIEKKKTQDQERQARSRSRRLSRRESHVTSQRDSTDGHCVNPRPPDPDPQNTKPSLACVREAEPEPEPRPSPAPPAERYVRIDDQLTDEMRQIAGINAVQHVEAAWRKFCGHYAGKFFNVPGRWQRWCVDEAQRERTERERQRDRAAAREPAPGLVDHEARKRVAAAQDARDRERKRREDDRATPQQASQAIHDLLSRVAGTPPSPKRPRGYTLPAEAVGAPATAPDAGVLTPSGPPPPPESGTMRAAPMVKSAPAEMTAEERAAALERARATARAMADAEQPQAAASGAER